MIDIDIEKTKKIANQILEKADDLNYYVNQLTNIIDRIDAAWNGVDSLKYINTMKENCVLELKKLNEIMEKYGEYLSTTPDAYAILDETFFSKNIGV